MNESMNFMSDPAIAGWDVWTHCQWTVWGFSAIVFLISVGGWLTSKWVRRNDQIFANINALTGMGVLVVAVASSFWHANHMLFLAGVRASGPARDGMMLLNAAQIAKYLAVSVMLAGLNQAIAVAARQRWKEPRPPPGN